MSKEIKEPDIFDESMFDEKELNKDNTEPMRDISTRQPKISLRSGAKGANDTQYFTGIDVVDPMTIDTLTVSKDGIYTPPSGVMGYNRVEVNCNKQPVTSGATIYDYDGTVIATYTPEEFAALESYPAHPEHEYLTPNGYNVALATAQAYAAKYGYVEVGAQYRVTDGKTRLFVTIKNYNRDIQIGLCVNGSVDIDWGDGSEHGSITGSSVTVSKYLGHLYAQNGDYIITLTITGVAAIGNEEDDDYAFIKPMGRTSAYKDAYIPYSGSLTKILIGDNIRLEYGAFFRYVNLETILIPDNINAIEGDRIFIACYKLKSIIIPNGITNLPRSFIVSCSSLTSIVIPYGPTTMPYYFASSAEKLEAITIPESITSINQNAFDGCCTLQKVIIPDSVTIIGDCVFSGDYCLCEINIPDSCTTIESDPLENVPIMTLEIPENVTSIDGLAYMYALRSLKFKSSTPPTITGTNPWQYLPTDCIIYVPQGSLSAYTSAANYPDPNTYTYVEY